MNANKIIYIYFIVVILNSANEINAQLTLHSYIDIGENNVSEGVFFKNAYRGRYQYHKFNFEAGMQFDLISTNPNTFSGVDIIASRSVTIQQRPLTIKGYYMINRFSDLLYESNWGIRMETRQPKHFIIELGTNFKTYALNQEGRKLYNTSEEDSRLSENFNLLYGLSAFLKPHTNDWNLSLSCTNIDYYVINQSTNPVFKLQTTYKIKSDLTVYLDAWYKQAGIFNISAHYFGYFFRGGVSWEI